MKIAEQKNGINYLCKVNESLLFQDLYFKVRKEEHRILSDEVVKQLPYVSEKMSVHFKEWKARAYSFENLKKYFISKSQPLTIMDLGCGNGWTCGGLAKNNLLQISGVDINEEELKQAARIFKAPNLNFYYGNISEDIFRPKSFDIIILNACVQYFENLPSLIERLFFFLKENGEIHFVDSPFYTKENVESAKQRSQKYYASIGFPQMAEFYHHHDIIKLKPFNYQVLSHDGFLNRVYSFVSGDLPHNFKWVRINKK